MCIRYKNVLAKISLFYVTIFSLFYKLPICKTIVIHHHYCVTSQTFPQSHRQTIINIKDICSVLKQAKRFPWQRESDRCGLSGGGDADGGGGDGDGKLG